MAKKPISRRLAAKPSWHGRFEKPPAPLTQQFVESLSFDRRLYKHDIAGSIAHARMLQSVGLVTRAELRAIERGLAGIAADIEAGRFPFQTADEDIHMAIEAALVRRAGEPGRKLHTARSRNDQVALDLRLYLRDAIDLALLPALDRLQAALVGLAEREGAAPMPGFTHLQHAQPVAAGAMVLSYVEPLERDRERLLDARKRINVSPLGACALAGTTLPIDRRGTAADLGFASVSRNSIDAVSDRDFAVEFTFDLSMIALHLSRWAEDWILWSSPEFLFIRLDDAHCTGSSIMPQKRNPDVLELIRGKSGGVFGQLVALLALLKGLPSGYNRDLQDDKRHVFAAYDAVLVSLEIAADVVRGSSLNAAALKARLADGFLEATGLAEYLVGRGLAFRSAHHLVGRIVAHCERQGKRLGELNLDELRAFSDKIERNVYDYLDPEGLVRTYRSEGSAGQRGLNEQLAFWRQLLSARSKG